MPGFDLTLAEAALINAAVLLGSVVRGFTGFGAALVIAPVLSVVVGPRVAVPAILLLLILSTLQLLPGAWRDIGWRRVSALSVAGCIGAPIGVLALVAVDQEVMRRGISAAVVVMTLAMMHGWRYRGSPSRYVSAGVGGLGGLLTGAASIGGPPVIAYLLASPDRVAVNRADIICYFLFVQLVALLVFAAIGAFGATALWVVAIMVPSQALGTWIGERLFRVASEAQVRRAALWLLLAIGLATLAA